MELGRQEQLALGETPNIAARIQGLAAPNTLVISEATSRLVEGYFTCESLGEPTLRGVSQPLKVYRVLEASGVTSRLDIVQPRGLTPLVVASRKSRSSWNGGSKSKRDKDRWSYSLVMPVSENPG